jgi:flagellar protein FliJ
MTRRFPLAAVLRVRRIQEDLAGAEVARARVEVDAAHVRARSKELRVEAASRSVPQLSAGFAGIMAARLSLAEEAAAARGDVQDAEQVVIDRLGAWGEARAARRGVERLAERHAEAMRADEDRSAQKASDDRAGSDHFRKVQETRRGDEEETS